MKRLLVLIADGSEEVEALTAVDFARRAGIETDLVSVMDGLEVVGAHKIRIITDKNIKDISADDYDAIYSPGGIPGAYNIRDNEKVIEIYKKMYDQGKIVSAICAAPVVLDRAGLIENRNVTSYPGFQKEFKSDNFNYKEDIVVKDENVLTGRGPAIAGKMAYELVEILAGKEKREKLEKETLYPLLMNSK